MSPKEFKNSLENIVSDEEAEQLFLKVVVKKHNDIIFTVELLKKYHPLVHAKLEALVRAKPVPSLMDYPILKQDADP